MPNDLLVYKQPAMPNRLRWSAYNLQELFRLRSLAPWLLLLLKAHVMPISNPRQLSAERLPSGTTMHARDAILCLRGGLAFVFLCLVLNQVTLAEIQSQFLAEAPLAWAESQASYRSFDAAGTRVVRDATAVVHSDVFRFKRSGPRLLLEWVRQGASPDDASNCVALVTNSSYGFKVSRDSTSREWQIRDVGSHLRNSRVVELVAIGDYGYLDSAWCLPFGISPARLLQAPGFSIASIEELADERVQVVFDCNVSPSDEIVVEPSAAKLSRITSVKGTIVTTPAEHWRIDESDVVITAEAIQPSAVGDTPVTTHVVTSTAYRPVSGRNLSIPAQVNVRIEGLGGVEVDQIRIAEASFREIPESEFCLPAFGLPGLDDASSQEISAVRICFIAATLLAIIAIVLVRTRRRAHRP
jgi:hypothetical protein